MPPGGFHVGLTYAWDHGALVQAPRALTLTRQLSRLQSL